MKLMVYIASLIMHLTMTLYVYNAFPLCDVIIIHSSLRVSTCNYFNYNHCALFSSYTVIDQDINFFTMSMDQNQTLHSIKLRPSLNKSMLM